MDILHVLNPDLTSFDLSVLMLLGSIGPVVILGLVALVFQCTVLETLDLDKYSRTCSRSDDGVGLSRVRTYLHIV